MVCSSGEHSRKLCRYEWALQKHRTGRSPKISREKAATIALKALQPNFLVALMWRRLLNRARLVIPIHKET